MRELLRRIEKTSGLSGLQIAGQLDVTSQRYYAIKKQKSFSFEILAALMRLPNIDPGEVGKWIEELF